MTLSDDEIISDDETRADGVTWQWLPGKGNEYEVEPPPALGLGPKARNRLAAQIRQGIVGPIRRPKGKFAKGKTNAQSNDQFNAKEKSNAQFNAKGKSNAQSNAELSNAKGKVAKVKVAKGKVAKGKSNAKEHREDRFFPCWRQERLVSPISARVVWEVHQCPLCFWEHHDRMTSMTSERGCYRGVQEEEEEE